MSQIAEIPLTLLDPNTTNARTKFLHIGELADAIFAVGQLQNIVVRPVGERFEVKAGDRRRLAFHRLVEQGRAPPDVLVRCLVIAGNGELESLVENIQREGLPPWDDGAAFDRLVSELGMTHESIGKAIGKSRSHVGQCIRICRGLSKKVIPILLRIGGAGPNFLQLLELAKVLDKDTLLPDDDKQVKWLEAFLTRGMRREGKKRYKTRRYYQDRLRVLERMEFPKDVDEVVQAVVRFLNGEEMQLPAIMKD